MLTFFARSFGVALSTIALASHAWAQPSPSTEAASDAEFRQKIEQSIQKCIRDKIETPELCRMIAYASALAAGFPPADAALITGYQRPQDGQQ